MTARLPGRPEQVPEAGSVPVTLTMVQAAFTVLYPVQCAPYGSAAAFSESVRACA